MDLLKKFNAWNSAAAACFPLNLKNASMGFLGATPLNKFTHIE